MIQYYVDFWKNYVNFSSRSRRAAFWYVMLMNVIIAIVLSVLMAISSVFYYVAVVYDLAIIIPSIALWVRRLHDIGKAGWWVLLDFVPLVGPIVLLVWACREGDHGANAYGPDPKEMEIL